MKGLCHRCEHRAVFLEDGNGPRSECKSNIAVQSCYMFCPVKPLILEKNSGDKRPQFAGSMSSARSHSTGVVNDFELALHEGSTPYWKPKT